MKIELPDRDVRMCDGGFLYWGDDLYECFDEIFGTIGQAETFEEKTGDEAPGGKLTFLPPSASAGAALANPAYQGSRLRFWLGEYDPMTGRVTGTPDLTADLSIDTVTVKASKGSRAVDIEFESAAKRLFMVLRGNALSDRFHQSCYPGELGMSNATGMPRSTAWGAATPNS
ncbi:hypothetical protein [Novosphingobium guangzhouense]|uniref:Uncharacterized protein n=1 Tax=Novosphingobium guangzhouense TaxID=1850347 RepID=A0A2K2FUR2_9SPHN|nr:hypothetical protein [Novosphingobium guangzhouense]PNU02523.1 hypothetical protein A8V01_09085 [Novosphingobium guangzhouense]